MLHIRYDIMTLFFYSQIFLSTSAERISVAFYSFVCYND